MQRTQQTPGTTPERIPWSDFLNEFDFQQGQHITLLGPTGYGKSTLAMFLQDYRRYVTVFATKKRDSTMDKIRARGYEVQKVWKPEVANHIIFKPPIDPDNLAKQRAAFDKVLTEIFEMGGWCCHWDEAVYLSHFLGLEKKMSLLWQQGRSLGVSIIATTQRPAHLPLYAYDQPTHFFFFKMKLDRDVERVSRLGGVDIGGMANTIRQLPKYETLYYNKDTDRSVITKVEV